jgi:transposase
VWYDGCVKPKGVEMGRRVEVIDEKTALLASDYLKELGRVGYVSIRLQAIKSASKYGIKRVSEVFEINRSSLNRWARNFRDKGIVGIQNASKPSRSRITADIASMIKGWLVENPNLTIKEIVFRLAKELKLKVGKSSVHRTLQKLKLSHVTPCPMHYKSDPVAQEEFKKN